MEFGRRNKVVNMRKKSSCTGCPAFSYHNFKGTCLLGYKIEKFKQIENIYFGTVFVYRPISPCKAPKSQREFAERRLSGEVFVNVNN